MSIQNQADLARQAAATAADLLRRDYLQDTQVIDDLDKDIKTKAQNLSEFALRNLCPFVVPVFRIHIKSLALN